MTHPCGCSCECQEVREAQERFVRLPVTEQAALKAAVAAIYFGDSSDYQTALWEVVSALDPGLSSLLERSESKAYDVVKAEE